MIVKVLKQSAGLFVIVMVLIASLSVSDVAYAKLFEYGPGATLGGSTSASDNDSASPSGEAGGSSDNATTPDNASQAPVDGDQATPDENGALLISYDEMTPDEANTYGSDRDSTNIPWATDDAFSNVFVYDLANLFSDDQYSTLNQMAQEFADQYQMGVYLLTTDYMNGLANPTSTQRTAYATGFYKQYGLGLGLGHDGIMLVIAATSRDYVTIAYGQGSYSFNDEGIEKMEDAVTDYLSQNEWYDGAVAYYDQIGAQLAYYERHGQPGSPLSAGEWAFRIALILIIPFVIALSVVIYQRSEMKPVRERHEAADYLDPNSLVVTAAADTFITTNLMVTARSSSSSSHSGGGDGWGGGGGGGFSSSGGGKF